jgi:hypothetical protein
MAIRSWQLDPKRKYEARYGHDIQGVGFRRPSSNPIPTLPFTT